MTNDQIRQPVRSDHLEATIIYALDQAISSAIPVLAYGDNENDLSGQEAVEALEDTLRTIRYARGGYHQDLYLITEADYKLLCDAKVLRGL
jgi:hypothetical protein